MRVEKISERVLMVDLEPSDTPGWLATYVIEGDGALAIIDPGPKSSLRALERLTEMLNPSRFEEVYAVLTHIHIDHSGVIGDLLELLPCARALVHPRGVKHLIDPSKLWQASLEVLGDVAGLLGEPRGAPQERVVSLENGAELDLGGLKLRALYTPGHAPHHVSYMLEPDGILFAGDSVANHFNGRIYPVTVYPFDGSEYLKSLDLLLKLQPRRIAVAHYGVVGEPEVFIQRARDKLISWTHHIISAIEEGASEIEDIYRRILSRDVELAYAKRLEDSMPAFRGATYRVVAGLYNYLRDEEGACALASLDRWRSARDFINRSR